MAQILLRGGGSAKADAAQMNLGPADVNTEPQQEALVSYRQPVRGPARHLALNIVSAFVRHRFMASTGRPERYGAATLAHSLEKTQPVNTSA